VLKDVSESGFGGKGTLASSPGRISRTAVWISRDEIVDFLL